MGLHDWYRYHVQQGSFTDSLYHLFLGAWRAVGKQITYGKPIWEESWDLLVVLDGCRYDMLAAVEDEYDWIETVDSRYSVGSESAEWLEKTFDGTRYAGKMSSTAYITANGKTDAKVDRENLHELDEIWRYGFDFQWNSIPAERVTDRAIDATRTTDAEHVVVHYMQPHFPVVPPVTDGQVPASLRDTDWEDVRRDEETSTEVVWEWAVANLRYVLDEVKRLLRNVDAERVVITADHGNLFGEARGGWLWGHPPNVPIPLLKRVPWAVTTANNTAEESPSFERSNETGDLEDKLAALGYR